MTLIQCLTLVLLLLLWQVLWSLVVHGKTSDEFGEESDPKCLLQGGFGSTYKEVVGDMNLAISDYFGIDEDGFVTGDAKYLQSLRRALLPDDRLSEDFKRYAREKCLTQLSELYRQYGWMIPGLTERNLSVLVPIPQGATIKQLTVNINGTYIKEKRVDFRQFQQGLQGETCHVNSTTTKKMYMVNCTKVDCTCLNNAHRLKSGNVLTDQLGSCVKPINVTQLDIAIMNVTCMPVEDFVGEIVTKFSDKVYEIYDFKILESASWFMTTDVNKDPVKYHAEHDRLCSQDGFRDNEGICTGDIVVLVSQTRYYTGYCDTAWTRVRFPFVTDLGIVDDRAKEFLDALDCRGRHEIVNCYVCQALSATDSTEFKMIVGQSMSAPFTWESCIEASDHLPEVRSELGLLSRCGVINDEFVPYNYSEEMKTCLLNSQNPYSTIECNDFFKHERSKRAPPLPPRQIPPPIPPRTNNRLNTPLTRDPPSRLQMGLGEGSRPHPSNGDAFFKSKYEVVYSEVKHQMTPMMTQASTSSGLGASSSGFFSGITSGVKDAVGGYFKDLKNAMTKNPVTNGVAPQLKMPTFEGGAMGGTSPIPRDVYLGGGYQFSQPQLRPGDTLMGPSSYGGASAASSSSSSSGYISSQSSSSGYVSGGSSPYRPLPLTPDEMTKQLNAAAQSSPQPQMSCGLKRSTCTRVTNPQPLLGMDPDGDGIPGVSMKVNPIYEASGPAYGSVKNVIYESSPVGGVVGGGDIYSTAGGKQFGVGVGGEHTYAEIKFQDGGGAGGRSLLSTLDPDGDGVPGVGKDMRALGLVDPDGDGVPGVSPRGGTSPMGGGGGGDAGMTTMMVGMMVSMSMQSYQTRVRDGIRNPDPSMSQEQAVTLAVVDAVGSMGGSFTMMGAMAASQMSSAGGMLGAGLGIQMLSGVITAGIQIYRLLNPDPPVPDTVRDKYRLYKEKMDTLETGNRWCLLPDTELDITLQFFLQSPHLDGGEKTIELWAAAPTTEIILMWHPMLTFDGVLMVTCAGGGMLRLNEANTERYVSMISESPSDGSRLFRMFGISVLAADYDVVTASCSDKAALRITMQKYEPSKMMLMRKAGVGEPPSTKSMPSDVCDQFPFKKFYVTGQSCEYQPSLHSVSHTTCSALFRMSSWDQVNRRWMVINPFSARGSNRKVFTFSIRDFRTRYPLKPNEDNNHRLLCHGADQKNFCKWPEPMILENTADCNQKTRIFRLEIEGVNITKKLEDETTISGLLMTCPVQSTPVYIMQKGKRRFVRETIITTDYAAKKFMMMPNTVIWVMCQHNTIPRLKSDIIEVAGVVIPDKSKAKPIETANFTKVTSESNNIMSARSQTGPTHMYQPSNHKAHITHDFPITYIKVSTKLIDETFLTVKTSIVTSHMDLDPDNKNYFASFGPMKTSAGFFANSYETQTNLFWLNAAKGCKTYSAMQISIASCNADAKGTYFEYTRRSTWIWSWHEQDFDTHYRRLASKQRFSFRHVDGGMEKCTVSMDITSRELTIDCGDNKKQVRKDWFKSEPNICIIFGTSSDQCRTNNEAIACADRYLEINNRKEILAGMKNGNWYVPPTAMVFNKFTYPQAWCAMSSVNHYDSNGVSHSGRSTTIVMQSMEIVDETTIDLPPYNTGDHVSETDLIIPWRKFQTVEELQDQVAKLMDLSTDPLISAINELSDNLNPRARNITTVTVDAEMLMHMKAQRDLRVEELNTNITNLLTELTVGAIVETEWFANMTHHHHKKCCFLQWHSMEAYLTVQEVDESYRDFVCPSNISFYKEHDPNSGYVMGPDYDYWSISKIIQMQGVGDSDPWLVCTVPVELTFNSNEEFYEFERQIIEEMTDKAVMAVYGETVENVTKMIEEAEKARQTFYDCIWMGVLTKLIMLVAAIMFKFPLYVRGLVSLLKRGLLHCGIRAVHYLKAGIILCLLYVSDHKRFRVKREELNDELSSRLEGFPDYTENEQRLFDLYERVKDKMKIFWTRLSICCKGKKKAQYVVANREEPSPDEHEMDELETVSTEE